MRITGRTRLLARVAAPILLAASLGACSSIPDWVDPTTWVGGSSQATSEQTPPNPDAAENSNSQDATQTPDLASIPPKPAPPSTADEQNQVTDSLTADRARAQYSADALRGGTEAAATPPPPAGTASTPSSPDAAASPDAASSSDGSGANPSNPSADTSRSSDVTATPPVSTSDQVQASPAPAEASAPAAQSDSTTESPSADTTTAPPPADTTPTSPPADTKASPQADTTTTSPAADATTSSPTDSTEVASSGGATSAATAPETTSAASAAPAGSTAETASAAPTGSTPAETTSAVPASNMEVTFAPSKAPALDPSVAQFVPQPILSRYRQTAAAAAAPGIAGTAAARENSPKPRRHKKIKTSDASVPRTSRHAGVSSTAGIRFAATRPLSSGLQQASFVPGGAFDGAGASPSGVVYFPHDTTILGGAARNQIEAAAHAFAAHGSTGYVRVVGHSSSRSANLSLAARQQLDFDRSQARATAVARELIRDGVPADRVLVEAVGNAEPSFNTLMSQGEDANRRAEIFLQS